MNKKSIYLFIICTACSLLFAGTLQGEESPKVLIKPKSGNSTGTYTSQMLTAGAWRAFKNKDFEQAIRQADKCIQTYSQMAYSQQASLDDFPEEELANNFWALNDVGTSYFIKGLSLVNLSKESEAKEAFQKVIDDLSFARCWDPRGWFWKVSDGSKDQILFLEKGIDFGTYTSEELTLKTWAAFSDQDFEAVEIYVNKVLTIYDKEAKAMQSSLKEFPPQETTFDYWALNDVGTCLYLLGRSYDMQNKKSYSKKIYEKILENYSFSQCWDPRGFFWKISDAVKKELLKLQMEEEIQKK